MSRSVLQVFENYQKARVTFVQTVAELSTRPQNIEALQNAGVRFMRATQITPRRRRSPAPVAAARARCVPFRAVSFARAAARTPYAPYGVPQGPLSVLARRGGARQAHGGMAGGRDFYGLAVFSHAPSSLPLALLGFDR